MFLLAEVVPDFVKILGYGLSGFAFLLMFFAYMLLRQVITKQTQNKMIFKSIWGFMGLSFVLTIIIGIFSYMTGDYKREELVRNDETITKQKDGIDALTNSQALDSLIKNVAADTAKTDTKNVDETIKKYEIIVANLQSKLNKVKATDAEKKKVSDLEEQNKRALDSLKKPSLTREARLRLNNRILSQTNEISRITTDAVKRDMQTPVGSKVRRQ
jgi:hypothetical protein